MRYLDKWYVWVCLLFALAFTYAFITAQVYAWHPTEIQVYANDEMVATAKAVMQTQRDTSFNDCLEMCFKTDKGQNGYISCPYSCDIHYSNESTSNLRQEIKMGENNYDRCLEKYFEVKSELIAYKGDV